MIDHNISHILHFHGYIWVRHRLNLVPHLCGSPLWYTLGSGIHLTSFLDWFLINILLISDKVHNPYTGSGVLVVVLNENTE